MRYQFVMVSVFLWAASAACLAQPPDGGEPAGSPEFSADEIDRLVEQLDADTFAQREAAHVKLIQIGKPAIGAIQAAMSSDSPEVRGRAKAIYWRLFGPGLVVYLPMDEKQLRQRHTQFPKGDKDRRGRPDQAIHFPGKGYLVLKDDPQLDTDYQFTLAAWINPSKIEYIPWKDQKDRPVYPWGQYPASWAGHFICCKWDSAGANGDYIFAVTPSGALGLGVADRNRLFFADSLVTKQTIPTNQWTHVAATFDRGHMKLFVNGEQMCEKRSKTVKHTNLTEYIRDDVYIGDFWNNAPGLDHLYNFHGTIDEFCIFRKALKRDEIQNLMEITQ